MADPASRRTRIIFHITAHLPDGPRWLATDGCVDKEYARTTGRPHQSPRTARRRRVFLAWPCATADADAELPAGNRRDDSNCTESSVHRAPSSSLLVRPTFALEPAAGRAFARCSRPEPPTPCFTWRITWKVSRLSAARNREALDLTLLCFVFRTRTVASRDQGPFGENRRNRFASRTYVLLNMRCNII